jgi:hypothetical protein
MQKHATTVYALQALHTANASSYQNTVVGAAK